MAPSQTNPDMSLIALGLQQPWAELILRGIKTIEVRSLATQVRGTIYLYASKRASTLDAADSIATRYQLDVAALPKGVLVGTVELVGSRPCTPADAAAAGIPTDLLAGRHAWMLERPQRLETPLPVRFLPYGVWFYPFRRKGGQKRLTL